MIDISCQNDDRQTIRVTLIFSEPIDEFKHGSKNGTVIQTIGYFRFPLPNEANKPDFFIFAFHQEHDINGIDFIVLPIREFNKRIMSKILNPTENRKHEMVFWLMPDRCVYDCTGIGIEGEWYFMSQGANGRMSDGTRWDYTEFLNNWKGLK